MSSERVLLAVAAEEVETERVNAHASTGSVVVPVVAILICSWRGWAGG
jgi:hypothetical protein